jgi:hypothetical protein
MDQDLRAAVDQALTQRWAGTENPGLSEVKLMHQQVIDVILEKYTTPGLEIYLHSIEMVQQPS